MKKNKPKILYRGNIVYLVYQDRVTAGVGSGQWVSYNQYDNWNRQGVTRFREAILKSKKHEYATPADLLTLAHEHGVRGAGTGTPKGIEL